MQDIAIERCGFYLEPHARYEYLLNLPEKEDSSRAIREAMAAIEATKPELLGSLPQVEYDRFNRSDKGEVNEQQLLIPKQLLRLFNDMVSAILACDKPVICRVNGMRIGGGQEIGMACDFSVAQDLARFGQAGPKHGSAPIGGATDFLPVKVGVERSMAAARAGRTAGELDGSAGLVRVGIEVNVTPNVFVDLSYAEASFDRETVRYANAAIPATDPEQEVKLFGLRVGARF
mgnify:CR=1 FL=1